MFRSSRIPKRTMSPHLNSRGPASTFCSINNAFPFFIGVTVLCLIVVLLPYIFMDSSLRFSSYVPREAEAQDYVIYAEIFRSPEAFKISYEEMERNFKVFVYPDGDENAGVSPTPEKLYGKYASEGYFFKNIRESRFLTTDADQAHFFFIPISYHHLRGQGIPYEDLENAARDYVQNLIQKYPYWNRSLGADHFFVACHHIGLTALRGVPLLKRSVQVVCAPTHDADYIPHKDVCLPQIQLPIPLPAAADDGHNRTILGFWAGVTDTAVRKRLVDAWENDKELDIQNNRLNINAKGIRVYQEKFYRSKFCICPRGSRVHGARIAYAIHYGCVPVIMSDYYNFPFNDILDWKKFSVTLKESDVDNLKKILEEIPNAQYRNLQKNTIKVQHHFQWNSPPVRFDVFHLLMYELWMRYQVMSSPQHPSTSVLHGHLSAPAPDCRRFHFASFCTF